MDRLEPCPTCRRHVRVSESSCPFCGADVSALGQLSARELPSTRLGRAALFAFGVGTAAAAANTVACTDEPDPDLDEHVDESAQGSKDAGASAGGTGTSDAGAASKDAGSNGGGTRFDAGSVVALYGLALPGGGDAGGGQPGGAFVPDSGKPDPVTPDAGRAKDAGPGADLGGAVALYGLAPFPDAGKPPTDAGRDASIMRRDAGGIVPLYGLAIIDPDESSS
jgi:hypothetical protein